MLNGVNLNALAERDPALYGGLAYPELETRIYGWARKLGCSVRCFQTNHEGEYVEELHRWLVQNPETFTDVLSARAPWWTPRPTSCGAPGRSSCTSGSRTARPGMLDFPAEGR